MEMTRLLQQTEQAMRAAAAASTTAANPILAVVPPSDAELYYSERDSGTGDSKKSDSNEDEEFMQVRFCHNNHTWSVPANFSNFTGEFGNGFFEWLTELTPIVFQTLGPSLCYNVTNIHCNQKQFEKTF